MIVASEHIRLPAPVSVRPVPNLLPATPTSEQMETTETQISTIEPLAEIPLNNMKQQVDGIEWPQLSQSPSYTATPDRTKTSLWHKTGNRKC